MVAYERAAGPGARKDVRIWREQHRRPEIHNEIMKQMMLLARLRALLAIDSPSVEVLRAISSKS